MRSLILVAVFSGQCLASCEDKTPGSLSYTMTLFSDASLVLFSVLYLLSIIFKLLDFVLTKFSLYTSWKWDDNLRSKLLASPIYQVVAFSADLFLRIKLPKRK